MNRWIFFTAIFVFVALVQIESAPAIRDSKCSPWVFGECRNMTKGTCGKGTKKGTRSGSMCQSTEKTESCKMPCPGDKKVCKYRKTQFGECDDIVGKRFRVDTLMTEISDNTCEPTKKTEKMCKKKCVFGAWTEGECKDGKIIKTRQIKSGGEECRRKATKTRNCGETGGKRRGGGSGRHN